jgi:hypothetical protein
LEDGLKLDLNRLFRDGFAKRDEVRRGLISSRRVQSGDIKGVKMTCSVRECELVRPDSVIEPNRQ